MPRALVVDDDVTCQDALALLVREEGFDVTTASTLAEARTALATHPPDVVLVDLQLPDGTGLALVHELADAHGPDVVMVTGNGTVDTAVDAIRAGAADYLEKPADLTRLRAVLLNVARRRELQGEIGLLRGELRDLGRFGSLIGRSPAMQATYDLIARVAPTDVSVLITGESGTGKELVASTIHARSRRKDAPFVAVNCGAISPTLLESELFGHERGSFTGAARAHRGFFERAHGGTLFLDEITEMPVEFQVRLLRVLETATFMRVGGESDVTVDVRVIAATNRSPEAAVAENRLRDDLLYRLGVFPIALAPLRDRGDDVVLLAEAFLAEINEAADRHARFTRQAIERLRLHGWPGNVRELRNAVQRAFILADDDLDAVHLPIPAPGPAERGPDATLHVTIGTPIAEVERRMILATLAELDGDKERSARTLGVSLKTLYNKLKKYRHDEA